MEVLPSSILIDNFKCKLNWSNHSILRNIQRQIATEGIIETLEKADELLDLKNNSFCWIRNSQKKISVLVLIHTKGKSIIIEVITVINKIAIPTCEKDKIIEVA
ncbi:hypothetical protein ACAG39_02030 [Caldicellulosiruptoraceae bacterium PP1]